jgi:hypothetical protein
MVEDHAQKPVKVLVSVPSAGMWHPALGVTLSAAVASCMKMWNEQVGTPIDFIFDSPHSSGIISHPRNQATHIALGEKCTHLLFIDTDQSVPVQMIYRWLRMNLPVVAANIAKKTAEPRMVAEDATGAMVITWPESSGFQEVHKAGTGAMMIRADVLQELEADPFRITWNGNCQVGEDWNFCDMCLKAGIPMFIDHEVSKEIGHHGDLIYRSNVMWGDTDMGIWYGQNGIVKYAQDGRSAREHGFAHSFPSYKARVRPSYSDNAGVFEAA